MQPNEMREDSRDGEVEWHPSVQIAGPCPGHG
jgi:hypothetical protein